MPAINRVCWDCQGKITYSLSCLDRGWLDLRFCWSKGSLCPFVPCSHYSFGLGVTKKMAQTPDFNPITGTAQAMTFWSNWEILLGSLSHIRCGISQMRIGKLLSEACYTLTFFVVLTLSVSSIIY